MSEELGVGVRPSGSRLWSCAMGLFSRRWDPSIREVVRVFSRLRPNGSFHDNGDMLEDKSCHDLGSRIALWNFVNATQCAVNKELWRLSPSIVPHLSSRFVSPRLLSFDISACASLAIRSGGIGVGAAPFRQVTLGVWPSHHHSPYTSNWSGDANWGACYGTRVPMTNVSSGGAGGCE